MNTKDKQEKLFQEFPPVSTELWEEKIREDLKGADYEKKLIWKTLDGLNIKPYYRAEHLQHLDYLDIFPGQYPYVRGNNFSNSWEICQEIDVSDFAQANAKALHIIENGADAIIFKVAELAFREQLSKLLKNINLEKTSIHFTSSHSYSILADLFIEFVKNKGFDTKKIKGSFNFDSLSYYLLHGEYYNSKEDNFNEAAALIGHLKNELPNYRIININGQLFSNAGATIVQELGFALASANEYLAQLTEKGLNVDDICKTLQITLGIGSNYFLEIAKLRAARMLFARLIEQYQPSSEESLKPHIHSISCLWNKTLYDPYVNMLRLTTEAMSAAIGGANTITLLPFNTLYQKNDEFGERIARNVQIILKTESYFDKVIDPSAGSYLIENLTDEIAKLSWELFKKTEEWGGMAAALEKGFIKQEIEKTVTERLKDIAQRKTPILGTNIFPNLQENMLEESKNMEKKTTSYLKLSRAAEPYEEIRLATEEYVKKANEKPKVFLATYGNLAMRKARANFSLNFFGCAGYEILEEYYSTDIEQTVQQAIQSNAKIFVICSSDEEYAHYAPELAQAVKHKNPDTIVVIAGYPKDLVETLQKSGVDVFIHIRVNVIETLLYFQKKLGIM